MIVIYLFAAFEFGCSLREFLEMMFRLSTACSTGDKICFREAWGRSSGYQASTSNFEY